MRAGRKGSNRRLSPGGRAVLVVTMSVILAALAVVGIVFSVAYIISRDGGASGKESGEVSGRDVDNKGDHIMLPDWIDVDLLPINEYSRPGEPTDDIVGIVIHYVGNPGTSAKANRNYFAGLAKSGATYASSNFIIGLDGEIIECVPLGEIAYCSNNRNHDTVSIECCHPDETGEFTPETYESLLRLCRYITELYNIEPENVIRHHDVTGKLCPLYYVEHEDAWKQLVDDIFKEQ